MFYLILKDANDKKSSKTAKTEKAALKKIAKFLEDNPAGEAVMHSGGNYEHFDFNNAPEV
jgi:S-ribosylhomocysteine lyase LuxS involved in autoinducer biosynthesis